MQPVKLYPAVGAILRWLRIPFSCCSRLLSLQPMKL